MAKTINEPARNIAIFDEVDVLVVGAGPAGHCAAIAAARSGVGNVALVERYNHLGGMATGGYVIAIPHMSLGETRVIQGLQQEWIDRLEKFPDGVYAPKKEETGLKDPDIIAKYDIYSGLVVAGAVRYGAYVDADILKIVLDQMIEEAKIKTYLHTWGVAAVMDGNRITGVVLESKEGRKAIMAKVVIDCTGDADILAFAGGEYEDARELGLRSSQTASVYRLGGVDNLKFGKWRNANGEEWREVHMPAMQALAGFRFSPFPAPRNDICWVNNWIDKYCCDVKDMTETDMLVRRTLMEAINYMKKLPGMEGAYLLDINPQTGTRGSRRIKGEYYFTNDDLTNAPDQPTAISAVARGGGPDKNKPVEVPYGVMVPVKIESLLVAGRSFSSALDANNAANLIPHCATLGHAAGVAAAVSLNSGASVRSVDITAVQKILKDQGAWLPR